MAYNQLRDYALVVGIDNYPKFGTNGRDLKGAIRDARLFSKWLLDNDKGGGVPADHCKVITSDGNPMALNKDTIDDAMDEIWNSARNNGGGRRLYMFFSGHGQLVDSADFLSFEQTLCLPRWSYTRPNAAILTDSYRKAVQNCMPFEEIAVFLDCCRVSTMRVRADNTSLGCLQPRQGFDDVKKQVFFAAEPMKRAFEGNGNEARDNDGEGEIVHGHFTSALIQGLKKGHARPGGGISAKELWEHLRYWVPRVAEDAGQEQKPRTDPPNPYDDMIFGCAVPEEDEQTPVAADANFEIRFSDWRAGPVQLLDASADVVREGDPQAGSWPVTLRRELYLLVDTATQDTYSLHFRPQMEGSHVTF